MCLWVSVKYPLWKAEQQLQETSLLQCLELVNLLGYMAKGS